MKFLITIAFVFISSLVFAQRNIAVEIKDRIAGGQTFHRYDLFIGGNNAYGQKLGGNYKQFLLDTIVLNQFISARPSQFEVTIPGILQQYSIKMIRSYIIEDTAKFTVVDAQGHSSNIAYNPPLFYHGVLDGVAGNTFVTASVSKLDGVRFFISFNRKNIQVAKIADHNNTLVYGCYENLPGNNEPFNFDCGTNENAVPPVTTNINFARTLSPQSYGSKVVRCFFDCAYTYYQQNGSSTGATFNRITTLFNQAALCYANESINVSISQIRVWTSADPYNHTNRDVGKSSFKNYVQNGFTGDLAMLCDWTSGSNSGIADGIGVLCQPYGTNPGPYIYNDLNYSNSYSNFPVAADAPAIYLIIHEIGHVVGSFHTHWCGWSGGPIDNCSTVEGTCSPGPTPVSGTMMSYCCTNGAIRIDFNNGFGPQPGNAIRAHISGSCIGNGTGTCDSTLYLQNSITNSDYTKFEVSNMITASCYVAPTANVVLDAGNKVRLIPGFSATNGSYVHIVNDGCGGNYRPVYRVFNR